MPRLENWSLVFKDKHTYLQGNVYEHNFQPDGKFITSSYIMDYIKHDIVQTCNNIYHLGQPSKDYVDWCLRHATHVPTENEKLKLSKKC